MFPRRNFTRILFRSYSYPPSPRKKRAPPPVFFSARTVEKIDSCAVTTAARLRSTFLLTYFWISAFQDATKRYVNLHGLLNNLDLWCCAYQRTCYNNQRWSPVSFIHSRTYKALEALRDAVCGKRYGWGGAEVVYLTSPEKMTIDATETKDESAFQDEVVQEVLVMILEPIYEARFSRRSFGYRPGRGPRTCLRFIHGNFGSVSWSVRGDLSKLFETSKPDVFKRVLTKVVEDDTVVELVYNGLKTPSPPVIPAWERKNPNQRKFFEFEARRKPFWLEVMLGFAPEEALKDPSWGCCRVLSPLLANILLDELDTWMDNQARLFHRPHDPSIGLCYNVDEQQAPDNSRRVEYVRYGAHFLISVRGTREDLLRFMEKCKVFCMQAFQVEPEFNTPTDICKPTSFLGHHFFCTKKLKTKWEPSSSKKGKVSKAEKTVFCVDGDKEQCVKSLKALEVLDEEENTAPLMRLFHEAQDHNNSHVNKILRALADWYQYSTNRDKMCEFFGYLFRSSLAKMYAAKYRLKTQVRVVKAGGMDLGRPIEAIYTPGVHTPRKPKPPPTEVEPLVFVDHVPDAVHAPIAEEWNPVHERYLRRVAKVCHREVLREELVALGDELHVNNIESLF